MKSISKLKKELDKWFSLYIRLRDATDDLYRGGEQYKFALNLDAKYGDGKAEELQIKSRQILKITRVDYEEKISYYKDLVEKIKKDKGIE